MPDQDQKIKILAFAGSTRKDSFNRKLLRVGIAGVAAAGAEVSDMDLRDLQLPLYDGDLEAERGLPEGAHQIKHLLNTHDGLLIASPEHNSSFSAVLKNAIDWASRPVPEEKPLQGFAGKLAATMSASPGQLGGLRGLIHLRAVLGNIGVMVLPQQVAIPVAHQAFDADGHLKDPKQQAAVEKLTHDLVHTLRKLKA